MGRSHPRQRDGTDSSMAIAAGGAERVSTLTGGGPAEYFLSAPAIRPLGFFGGTNLEEPTELPS